MNVEERLRAAMHAATDHLEPDEASGLAVVRARGRAARRHRRALLGGAAGALVLTASALVISRVVDDDSRTIVLSGGPSTTAADATASVPSATTTAPQAPAPPTTPSPTPTTTAAPTTPSASVADEVIWPAPGQPMFDDAVLAARSFVTEFVGLDDPPLGEFRATGADIGAVDVYGRTESGDVHDRVVSTIDVHRVDGHWFVTGAVAEEVRIDSPSPGGEVASPARVEGRGRGYEGTVVVEVRDAFQPAGENLGQEVTIAGCCEELVPFNALVAFAAPAGPRGVILARTDTGMERGMVDFTAIPVRFAAAASETGEVTTLHVFFTQLTDGTSGGLVAVQRTVPPTTAVLRASLVALLDGPTDDEAAAGLVSWLAPGAGGAVDGVNLDQGRATVRLSSRLADTTVAPPADEVIAELNATVFQFDNVQVVRYELDASCDAFDAWLQRGCEFTRGTGSRPSSVTPEPPPDAFICPEGGLTEVAELQAQVDSGHQPWRLSAPDVAAACTFGIPDSTVEPAGESSFRVTNAPTGRTVLVTVAQPIRPGAGGVWVVSNVVPVENPSAPSLLGASTAAVIVPATGCCDAGPFVLLTDVTTQSRPGFDRIVFEFSSPVVNYHVRYVPLPLTHDPSDLPVVLHGDSALQISIGATGIDQTVIPPRPTYRGSPRITVETGAVIELVQIGDFEAVSNWAVGLRGHPPFRVSTESTPSRLIIDVASP